VKISIQISVGSDRAVGAMVKSAGAMANMEGAEELREGMSDVRRGQTRRSGREVNFSLFL
jgi:hypothetical protein